MTCALRTGLCAVLLVTGTGCEPRGRSSSAEVPLPPREVAARHRECLNPTRGPRLEREGMLRRDRYPYDPRDGVIGVDLYLEAADCYRAADRPSAAARAAGSARRLSLRVESDYAVARIALQLALDDDATRDARQRVDTLIAFTEHLEPHPYVDWLRRMKVRLDYHDERAR